MHLSLFGLLLLTQPLHSSEQHTRANLEFSSNFDSNYNNFLSKNDTESDYFFSLNQDSQTKPGASQKFKR